jgi:hypothetical protein
MATAIVRALVAVDYPRSYPRNAQELPKKCTKAGTRLTLDVCRSCKLLVYNCPFSPLTIDLYSP